MTTDPSTWPDAPQSTTGAWSDAPLVFVEAIACPRCGSGRPITVRSQTEADGSVSRKSICRQCSGRYIAVVEPPEKNF